MSLSMVPAVANTPRLEPTENRSARFQELKGRVHHELLTGWIRSTDEGVQDGCRARDSQRHRDDSRS